MPAVHREQALAKLTRSLRITGIRDDGYHLIEAEMVTLDFGDSLEILPFDGPASSDFPPRHRPASQLDVVDEIAWIGTGRELAWGDDGHDAGAVAPSVPNGADNLVLRALGLCGRSAHVRLVKRIPPGAGLGGGSADAAAVLRWAGVDDPSLACRLGADVPFCVVGGRARVSGVGERIAALDADDATYLLCTPRIGVATADVYRAYDELGREPSTREPSSPGRFVNDLERAALSVAPGLARVRDLVADVTRRKPVLAGSGSTWYVACQAEEGAALAADLRAAVATEGRATVTLGRTVGAYAPLERAVVW